ncbi:MAG: DUF1080 domain-containing protein [Bryobacterales bacterium]|nr:DUF1080 domain-containing protein [Bryobacterales bacterium]
MQPHITTSRRAFLLGAPAAALGCRRSPEAGWRPLFDGKTLAGWRAIPRVPVAAYPGAPEPSPQSPGFQKALASKGRWVVEGGAITGGQDPPGSRLGAYLITEEVFGDFELLLDANPDWATDSGIMIRATDNGGQGFQVHMDYRMLGSVGTFFGNGIGNWRARHYAFNPTFDSSRRVAGLHREPAPDEEIRKLAWHSAPEEFFRVWKFGQWNTLKIRSVGELPRITTWVNGSRIAELDAATLEAPNYDRQAVRKLLGRQGHIALEVHDSGDDLWMGKDRWLPGRVCRYRNIRIRPLD